MGSGANETFQQVGAALGIAALGAVAHASIKSDLSDTLGLPAEQAEAASDAVAAGAVRSVVEGVPAGQATAVREAAVDAFLTGFHSVVTIGSVACLIGGVAALLLIRRRDFVLDPAAPDVEVQPEHEAAY